MLAEFVTGLEDKEDEEEALLLLRRLAARSATSAFACVERREHVRADYAGGHQVGEHPIPLCVGLRMHGTSWGTP